MRAAIKVSYRTGAYIASGYGARASSTNSAEIAALRCAHKIAKQANPEIPESDIKVSRKPDPGHGYQWWLAEWEEKRLVYDGALGRKVREM